MEHVRPLLPVRKQGEKPPPRPAARQESGQRRYYADEVENMPVLRPLDGELVLGKAMKLDFGRRKSGRPRGKVVRHG
jgi:hypothetical protein